MSKQEINYEDFEKIEMRAGTILEASVFEKARKASYQLKIDFGQYGIKNSSAQITDFYKTDDLAGKQIIAVVNFPPKQIANFFSECLVLGTVNDKGQVVLIEPEQKVENGLLIS